MLTLAVKNRFDAINNYIIRVYTRPHLLVFETLVQMSPAVTVQPFSFAHFIVCGFANVDKR
jgi:hypothetical protein